MRRAAVVAGILALAMGVIATPTVGAVEEDAPTLRTFQEIRDCVSNPEAQLNVLYVVDESGSLEKTDPDGVRAYVVANSLTQLGNISRGRTVLTAVATFAEAFTLQRPWTELTPEVAEQEATWASSTLGDLNQGNATNWLAALQGAAETMANSPRTRSACKIVVWMTDGAIQMPGSNDTSADVEAMAQICATDVRTGAQLDIAPVIAQLRTAGVNLIGVLLNDGTANDAVKAALTYMRPIVEGEGVVDPSAFYENAPAPFTYRCGQAPIPADQAAGSLIEARNPLDLAFKFAGIAAVISGGTSGPVSDNAFQIEEGIGYFQVLIAGEEWVVGGPDGDPVASPDTRSGEVSVSVSGPISTVEIRGSAVVPGRWSVKGAVGDIVVYLFSGVQLSLSQGEIFMNEPTTLSFTATRADVDLPDLSKYQPTTLTVQVSEPGGGSTEVVCTQEAAAARFACEYTPRQVGVVTIDARLPLTTLGGLDLQPVSLQTSLRVQPTPDYPQVREPADGSGIHQFSDLIGRRGAAQGTLELVGPAKGDGSICFPASSGIRISIDPQPERIPNYAFAGVPAGCVELPQGSTRTVSISITNPTSATGTVQGAFAVELRSANRTEAASQEVAFAFGSERKADPPIPLLIGLGLVALAIPLGLLYLQSWRAARMDMR